MNSLTTIQTFFLSMRTLFTIACFALSILPSFGAAFPYITLNTHTNRLSDNGTNLTYNGTAVGGASLTYASITNAMSWSGDTNNVIGGDGRERTVVGGGANWSASGATNSTLSGTASANAGFFTNSITGTVENNFYRGNSDGVSIGTSAGALVGTNNDVNVGFFAGYQATNSGFATRVGRHAGYDAYSAPSAVFVGHAAGQFAHNADSTVAIGYLAGRYNETSDHAVFAGPSAGQFATNAQGSVMIGNNAGESATGGNHSVLIGDSAGQNATTSPNSVMIGRWAGMNAADASQCVYIGVGAAQNFNRHHSLVIDTESGYAEAGTNALIYGEFDSRKLVLNGTTTVKSNFVATGTLSAGSTNAWTFGDVVEGGTTNITITINGKTYTLRAN